MPSNLEKIRAKYAPNPASEDARHRKSRAGELEFRHTKLLLEPYIIEGSEIAEFGCATGHYAEHWGGRCKRYLGVDLVQENVDYFNAKAIPNAKAQQGDATHCPELAAESFDVVLCLGPMYHLPAEERELAMAEMARLCRPGGMLAFAYCCKVGVMMHAITNRWGRKEIPWRKRRHGTLYPNAKGVECVMAGVSDIDSPFFFTMPEEMDALAERHGLRVLQNAGVDIALNADQINHMDEAQYQCMLAFAEIMLQYPSCTGMANHALMICEKSL